MGNNCDKIITKNPVKAVPAMKAILSTFFVTITPTNIPAINTVEEGESNTITNAIAIARKGARIFA